MKLPKLEAHIHSIGFVSGIVFGVSAAPEIPMPETWMPWVLKGTKQQKPLAASDVNKLADGLVSQLQWQLRIIKDEQRFLPEACIWSESEAERITLQQWLQGVLFAHSQLEEVWFNAWQKADLNEAESRLTRCLKCFSVLADTELAMSGLDDKKQKALTENLPILAKQLEPLLKDYVNLAGELAASLPGQFEMYNEIPKPFQS
ncbi:UPF0149 family protein [Alteromonas sp. 5E99-2]|uniref:UPF0149 family protein n=1 Tax=Alteromonas sp. 5E99-2 TaxID=2817683 RepID=UPI001A98C4CD|nr:UPF0149 family protein [Alteromonas sp. 5E99-2]MBO1254339.1 UPF0149 family protein [Alteromonas sp. 5E99-2]